ncbi:MAG TPA: hypothetical protein VNY83_04385 [Solirubrobacterales bacterium]|jgi:hypothetical protein|nr:hypothetical protein [Solirubrobacterales bacterium]
MRRLKTAAEFLVFAVIVAGGAFLVLTWLPPEVISTKTQGATASQPTRTVTAAAPKRRPEVTVSRESAESLVSEAVNQVANYNPKVICPEQMIGSKGSVFRCEALVRERLVPVSIEIVSRLGFIRVVQTPTLRQLAGETEVQEAKSKQLAQCENLNVSPAAIRAERECTRGVEEHDAPVSP